jgi:hypothetical protein
VVYITHTMYTTTNAVRPNNQHVCGCVCVPTLLCRRLGLEAGHDVRSPAALLTHKMAAITSRAGPAGGAAGGHAGQGEGECG